MITFRYISGFYPPRCISPLMKLHSHSIKMLVISRINSRSFTCYTTIFFFRWKFNFFFLTLKTWSCVVLLYIHWDRYFIYSYKCLSFAAAVDAYKFVKDFFSPLIFLIVFVLFIYENFFICDRQWRRYLDQRSWHCIEMYIDFHAQTPSV